MQHGGIVKGSKKIGSISFCLAGQKRPPEETMEGTHPVSFSWPVIYKTEKVSESVFLYWTNVPCPSDTKCDDVPLSI